MKQFIVLVFDETEKLVQKIPIEAKGKKSACFKAIPLIDKTIKGDVSLRAE